MDCEKPVWNSDLMDSLEEVDKVMNSEGHCRDYNLHRFITSTPRRRFGFRFQSISDLDSGRDAERETVRGGAHPSTL